MRVIQMSFLLFIVLMVPATAFSQVAPAQDATETTAAVPSNVADSAAQEPAQSADQADSVDTTEADEVATPQAEATAAGARAGASIPAPPEGKGQIVFFRDKKFAGAALSYIVREDNKELGKLSNGTWFVHVTEPGRHAYVVHSEAKDVLNLEVEDGETHYVSGSISMGVLAGRPNLSPSDQAAFDKAAGDLKPSKPLKKK